MEQVGDCNKITREALPLQEKSSLITMFIRDTLKKQWAESTVSHKSSPLGSPMRSRFVSPAR
jgi:hypothetical protein